MTDNMKKIEKCELCGNSFKKICDPKSYVDNHRYDCSFWIRKIKTSEEDKARRVIVDGQHYRIGHNNSWPFRGFGGRNFKILFHDGRLVETGCLWHQGHIPLEFRQWLPDNAVFVQAEAVPVTASDDGIPF